MIDLRVHPDADVSDEYRAEWERGQAEADEIYERMKYGGEVPDWGAITMERERVHIMCNC